MLLVLLVCWLLVFARLLLTALVLLELLVNAGACSCLLVCALVLLQLLLVLLVLLVNAGTGLLVLLVNAGAAGRLWYCCWLTVVICWPF
jgi:hypothetical protein